MKPAVIASVLAFYAAFPSEASATPAFARQIDPTAALCQRRRPLRVPARIGPFAVGGGTGADTGLRAAPSAEAADLLYMEQEKLLVSRGEWEGEAMAGKAIALEANVVKVRGTGKAGGFGGGRSKVSPAAIKAEGKAHAKVLKKDGVVRIDRVLSAATADRMKEYVTELRRRGEAEVEAGGVPLLKRFASVLLRKDRCDLTLPLGQDDIVAEALNEVLRESSAGATVRAILGKGSIMHELSCLISDPGSQRQVLHPDTPFMEGKGPVLFTCFVALQDVRLDMGPTTWLPGTHSAEAHEIFKDEHVQGGAGSKSRKDELIRNSAAVLGMLPKGSCAIFDSRTVHCGTANQSETDSRALFYFSFKNPTVGYTGNPPSIRPEIGAAQISMEDLEKDLKSFSEGKAHPLLDQIGKSLK